jgi:hypothetical protein
MVCLRDIDCSKLLDIILLESWRDALLERLIVRDDVADIYVARLSWFPHVKEIAEPFKTSLISPGGDWRRKFETA